MTAKQAQPPRQRSAAAIWVLGLVSMLTDISSEMIHGLLPVFLITTLGASTTTLGLIEGVAEATAAITKVFSGWFSDRIGNRKWLTVAGYGLAAITKPAFPFANNPLQILAARFADRIGKGIRDAPRDALIADITPRGGRGAAYGLRQSLDTIGAVGGPLLAIGLMELLSDNIRAVFAWAVAPAVLAVLLVVFGVKEPARPKQPVAREPIAWAEVRGLGVQLWAITAVGVVFTLARFSEAFMIVRAQTVGLPLALAPLVLVAMNLVYAMAAAPLGRLSDRIGRPRLLAAGMAVLIAADLLLAFSSHVGAVMVGAALWGLHLALTQGLFSAIVADTAPTRLRGTAFGLFNLATGLALLAASALAGLVWTLAGPTATFLVGGGFAVAALIGLGVVQARQNRGQAASPHG